ncbi:mandelate racemase/muconate lactonizing enzyme family protein [Bordetella petrii]|uniref:mandelate racemase/muconate lactonizing enzyme family protein n=1 Tax=Bordetella petrii TaxID=94624 RepID=UPI001A956B8C|nr:mandelate racemase/muconate lactonizing enzyme family protein [Bordetella petrii]MBO1112597.1 mandelate racemase/muconate lactonizing enzyme family protein [Bordetella petrii]
MRRNPIEKIETYLVDRWCIVRVICADGTSGIGEAGVHAWPGPTAAMVRAMSAYLVGKDPALIEHHAQYLLRNLHFGGAVIAGAISALDIALWDIKGKQLQAPIHDLMGGSTRDKVRCYIHIHGDSTEALVQAALARRGEGFTAVRFSPFAPRHYRHRSFEGWAAEARQRVGAVHEAVGKDMDLCIELHRQMDPAQSIALAQRLRQFHPYFYEDPMLPGSPSRMAEVQARGGLPVATGERFTSIHQFQQVLAHAACDFIRPDVCMCLGLTGAKKVAALGEAHHVKIIPHNPLSPISTAACVQLDACIPNFALQEYTGEDQPPKRDLVKRPLVLRDGYLEVPQAPGLGIELNLEAIAQLPASPCEPAVPIGLDGSVQDW